MSQRKSDNRTNKYCTGCGKTTAHDVCGQGTIACRQCGHTLGNVPAKPSRGNRQSGVEPWYVRPQDQSPWNGETV